MTLPKDKELNNSYKLAAKLRVARRKFSLTAGAQALYYELIAINNEEGWDVDEFKCPAADLCAALGTSEKTLAGYRQELIDANLITYLSGQKKRYPSWYSLNGSSFGGKFYHQKEHLNDYQNNYQSEHPSIVKTPDLIKLKDKEKEKVKLFSTSTTTYEAAFFYFKQTTIFRRMEEQYKVGCEEKFKIFYEEKNDLNELQEKTQEDLVKWFRNWLPAHLEILNKEKNSAKKENYGSKTSLKPSSQPVSQTGYGKF